MIAATSPCAKTPTVLRRAGAAPQALVALRNTMLRLVHSLSGSLAAIRDAFAEDGPHAIAPANTAFSELPCLGG